MPAKRAGGESKKSRKRVGAKPNRKTVKSHATVKLRKDPQPQRGSASEDTARSLTLLEELRQHVSSVGRASFGTHGLYRLVARASLVKAFEFAIACQRDAAHPFFLMATLRGICEDTIVLAFLLPLKERNEVVRLLAFKNLAEATHNQAEFFKSTRPWQPVLAGTKERVQQWKQEIKTLAQSKGWGNELPTVRRMAELCSPSLVPLYDYLYSATSRIVHFSPHVLMRMGWGPPPAENDPQALQAEWTFSTSNFEQYYREFSRFYSIYLLVRLIRALIDEFPDCTSVRTLLDAVDSELDSEIRWPEVVTFEERNLKGPSFVERILLRAAHDVDHVSSDEVDT